ncbi:MAG: hypothetical protein FWG54_06035, partial [Bacteroidetes bacterium]|nr:hypothetical protein [Bacteroidota bacterium]
MEKHLFTLLCLYLLNLLLLFFGGKTRMKKICLSAIIFLWLPLPLKAQNEDWGKHRIFFTPTRLLNPIYPGLEFGYEYRYSHFSSQCSVAYLFNFGDGVYKSLTGYHIKFEEKYFIKKKPSTRRVKFYLSAETSYNYVKANQCQYFLPLEAELITDWNEKYQYAYLENFDL